MPTRTPETVPSPTADVARSAVPDDSGHPAVPAIAVRNLTVQFGGIAALTDVTTSIPLSKVVAIVGANGAGKTTLLNAMSGFLSSNLQGLIELFGEETQHKSTLQM